MVTTLTKHYEARTCADLLARLDELENLPSNTPTMPPLFATEADRTAFNERHHREHIHQGTLEGAQGPHFLGIDAGSTTIKATLVNDDREIVGYRTIRFIQSLRQQKVVVCFLLPVSAIIDRKLL